MKLQNLHNTRDLGGMRTIDGRAIRPGRLIRSGELCRASVSDARWLSDHVSLIVDFRTAEKRKEMPDPALPNVENLHLPVLESLTAGISRDAKSDKEAYSLIALEPDRARDFMIGNYQKLIASDYSRSQYAAFIGLLTKPRDGAILWHCTAGKDRAGFASVIVQEILGVSHDGIAADYLKTNECLAEEYQHLRETSLRQAERVNEQSLAYLFGAHEEYLAAVYQTIENVYGGFQGFIREGLGVSEETQEGLRRMYLE